MYGRSALYKIFSRCFCYPDQNFVHYARGDLLKDLESSLRELPYTGDMKRTSEFFQSALIEQWARLSLEDWQVEYTGLFIYCRGKLFCSPYASTWIEDNKRLIGESTMAVKRFYGNFKLRVARPFADLPDHLAAELEFMHFLSLNEAKFEADGKSQGRDLCLINQPLFLEKHLQPWVPKVAACLKENSDSQFFTALAQLTSDFLTAEIKHLEGGEKAETKTKTLPMDTASLQFDTSTLTVLEPDETAPESKVKWIYTTLPERFPCSPVKVKVVDGVAVEVETRDALPFFRGKREVRAFVSFAQLYATDKLKFPLKRVGERGEGKFKRISWEEALSEIVTVLKKHRDEGNARYVAFLRTHPPLENMFNHFTHYYGTPNDVHASTTSCYADGVVADAVTGGNLGEDDYLNAKYALYIGHNLLNGIRAIPDAARFAEGIRRGMKFVFVDPRLNEGSYTYGAEWVPIKPGTDAAFVLALMNVIVKEKLYDEDFLLRHTNGPILIKPDGYPLKNKKGDYLVWDASVGYVKPIGEAVKPALQGIWDVELDMYRGSCKTAFQLLAERVDQYTPEEAARITTIGKERIQKIARDLGTMKPQVCIFSRRNVSAQYSNSLQYCRARNVLMCLLGIFDKAGGKHYGASGSGGHQAQQGGRFSNSDKSLSDDSGQG